MNGGRRKIKTGRECSASHRSVLAGFIDIIKANYSLEEK